MKICPGFSEISRELVMGENKAIMEILLENKFQNYFKMIYFDGPFNSGVMYTNRNKEFNFEYSYPWLQYDSIYHYIHPLQYLEDYKKRLEVAKELLREDGFIVLQTNQLYAHKMKHMLDNIFGSENMLPEVIWKHSSTPWPILQDFGVGYQHENIFFYSKSKKALGTGSIQQTLPSVWDDIPGYVEGDDAYPTQKPEALIERIIDITSQEGDVIGDFYCGSGTFPYMAEKKNRKWLACDNNPHAIKLTRERLYSHYTEVKVHQVLEPFRPSNLGKFEYTKKERHSFSKLELEELDSCTSERELVIHAYQYDSDIDQGKRNNKYTFYYLFPFISKDGYQEGKTIKIPRPIPIRKNNTYSLYVAKPMEWILSHLVHVDRDDLQRVKVKEDRGEMKPIILWEDTVRRARKIVEQVQSSWITHVQEEGEHTTLVDIFGYEYVLPREVIKE